MKRDTHQHLQYVTAALMALAGTTVALAQSAVLYTNGPIITDPTGGTGAIAGLPISNADGFTVPGQTFVFSTTGVGASIPIDTALADDFTVPAGEMWMLDAVRLYAFQSSQTTATVTQVAINLWTAPPFSAGSPPPVPNPLPQPVLIASAIVDAGPGTFVCHRQSVTSTSTVRPVFSYDVSLQELFCGVSAIPGAVGPGTYWIQWSFLGAATPSNNVFTPLVTPRTSVVNHNARQYAALSGNVADPRVWFEGREGFVAGVADGRAYELPFEIIGEVRPPNDCYANCDGSTGGAVLSPADFTCFLGKYRDGDFYANCDCSTGSPALSPADFSCFLANYQTGCRGGFNQHGNS
jgi:hypothetical protein